MKHREDNLYQRQGIYGIRNKINNKIYVGKTAMNFGDRRDSHFSLLRNNKHKNIPLQDDWNTYGGEQNFEFVVLHDLKKGEDINNLEVHYIKHFKDLGLSYNIAKGGDEAWNKGGHITEEAKRKIGEKNKINMAGFVMPEETKQKISKANKELWNKKTKEEKEAYGKKMSELNKGRKMKEEFRQKLIERERTCSNAATHTPEQIKEIRRLHEQEGMSNSEIAKLLGETTQYIGNITAYRRWKYI